jgi:lysozyme
MKRNAIAIGVGAAVAALAATQARAAASPELVGPPDLGPAPGPSPDEARAEQNVRAFLAMIKTAEGTADANGYRALFGHTTRRPRLFDSFADHPRVATRFTDKAGRQRWTSAAGAYQFMAVSPIPGGGSTRVDTWDNVQRALGLPDFSPESQDRAAVELIRRRGALGDVRAGRFAQAVGKVRAEWASLPGAGYDQPERTLEAVQTAYLRAGGTLA